MSDEQRPPSAGRPGMPRGYGIAQGAEGVMAWDHAVDQLTASRNYWITSTRPDGRPHAMPVWGVWIDGALIFSTDRTSRKARNIAARPAIVVHLESGDDMVVLEGVAEVLTDAALLARYVEAYGAKYHVRPDPADAGNVTLALRPSVAFAWLERDFPNTATRWVFG
ncbi:MAG TPA: pyridoxamine 5'-phosphate oxidase family protein [Dehalococcoidia bacterium]|nr:pyridoxamine 5'-phosphate oxidase family protein [Dehalococcoidia bacterium]